MKAKFAFAFALALIQPCFASDIPDFSGFVGKPYSQLHAEFVRRGFDPESYSEKPYAKFDELRCKDWGCDAAWVGPDGTVFELTTDPKFIVTNVEDVNRD